MNEFRLDVALTDITWDFEHFLNSSISVHLRYAVLRITRNEIYSNNLNMLSILITRGTRKHS